MRSNSIDNRTAAQMDTFVDQYGRPDRSDRQRSHEQPAQPGSEFTQLLQLLNRL